MEDEKEQNVDTQTTSENNVQEKEQKTENKNEGTKANEQKARGKNGITKNEDGSLTFESQEKLEEFAKKMFAKGANKVEQGKKIENTSSQDIQEEQEQNTQMEENDQEQNQGQVIPPDYLLTKVALAMAKAGVNTVKVERASRLVDINKIQENGVINDKSLEDEINAVITEFPELKNAKEEEKQEKGFKFGATESNSNSSQTPKKSVVTKRWNRFNNF